MRMPSTTNSRISEMAIVGQPALIFISGHLFISTIMTIVSFGGMRFAAVRLDP